MSSHVLQGLVQIEILRAIERLAGAPISELFDWIVGTSTGGIVALGTVYGKSGGGIILLCVLCQPLARGLQFAGASVSLHKLNQISYRT